MMMSEEFQKRFSDKERLTEVDVSVIENIIRWFENIKTRPLMFYGESDNPKLVENGMYWFQMALVHLGYNFQPKENEIVKRNLHRTAKGLEQQLRERGLTDEEIVREIIDIEIENWKQLLKEIESFK